MKNKKKGKINSYEIQDSQDKYGPHQTTEIFSEVVDKMLEVAQRVYWFYSDHHASSCRQKKNHPFLRSNPFFVKNCYPTKFISKILWFAVGRKIGEMGDSSTLFKSLLGTIGPGCITSICAHTQTNPLWTGTSKRSINCKKL